MDLFEHNCRKLIEKEQPLAARMRPRVLSEYVGQGHILATGRLLRRSIQADRLSSLIFYGPPGTGKTTLASVIANSTKSHFEVLNAVLSGVKDIRRVTKEAKERRGQFAKKTILFVDEVHRWNKAQQDALLPWVENGTIILIGATTENPFFTVNRALVSRSRIFQLKPLTDEELQQIVQQTLTDSERGYGNKKVVIEDDALNHLVNVANGDARALLNALELAVETTDENNNGDIIISLAVAEESIQQRAVLYDKEGDCHFDTISAFIKSMRGSDPDATMYWLAKMIYAGEDPKFIFRRMLIFCGEDIGLADPNALVVINAATQAFERVGMPEGRYHLGMAALYLATTPKSNSTFAFFDALASIEKEREGQVPTHLRDASRDKKEFGHGADYLYPHAYRDHWVAQQYLPDTMQGKIFYQPGKIGYESTIKKQINERRELQLAAVIEQKESITPTEILTYSTTNKNIDRWLQRTISGVGQRLGEIRKSIFAAIKPARHTLFLIINADSGLLLWEALRKAPEGGVWALVSSQQAAKALQEMVAFFPEMQKPNIIIGPLQQLPNLLNNLENSQNIKFDYILGYNSIFKQNNKFEIIKILKSLLLTNGTLALAETVPQLSQRLYNLVDLTAVSAKITTKLKQAEENIYANQSDDMVNWLPVDLENMLQKTLFANINIVNKKQIQTQIISKHQLQNWFSNNNKQNRKTYLQHLQNTMSTDEIELIKNLYEQLQGKYKNWQSTIVFIFATL